MGYSSFKKNRKDLPGPEVKTLGFNARGGIRWPSDGYFNTG